MLLHLDLLLNVECDTKSKKTHKPRQGFRQTSKWAECDLAFTFIFARLFPISPPFRCCPRSELHLTLLANAGKTTLTRWSSGVSLPKKKIPAVSRRYLRRPWRSATSTGKVDEWGASVRRPSSSGVAGWREIRGGRGRGGLGRGLSWSIKGRRESRGLPGCCVCSVLFSTTVSSSSSSSSCANLPVWASVVP